MQNKLSSCTKINWQMQNEKVETQSVIVKQQKKVERTAKNWFLQIQTTSVSLYNEIKKVKKKRETLRTKKS